MLSMKDYHKNKKDRHINKIERSKDRHKTLTDRHSGTKDRHFNKYDRHIKNRHKRRICTLYCDFETTNQAKREYTKDECNALASGEPDINHVNVRASQVFLIGTIDDNSNFYLDYDINQ
jgi:hypothetical protein